eukprot:SAG11_NODE_358_length_10235_cov_5.689917_5_plen_91_part_00
MPILLESGPGLKGTKGERRLLTIASRLVTIGHERSILASSSMSNPKMSGLEVMTQSPKCASSAANDSKLPTSIIWLTQEHRVSVATTAQR